eukprot:gene11448-biopygen7265
MTPDSGGLPNGTKSGKVRKSPGWDRRWMSNDARRCLPAPPSPASLQARPPPGASATDLRIRARALCGGGRGPALVVVAVAGAPLLRLPLPLRRLVGLRVLLDALELRLAAAEQDAPELRAREGRLARAPRRHPVPGSPLRGVGSSHRPTWGSGPSIHADSRRRGMRPLSGSGGVPQEPRKACAGDVLGEVAAEVGVHRSKRALGQRLLEDEVDHHHQRARQAAAARRGGPRRGGAGHRRQAKCMALPGRNALAGAGASGRGPLQPLAH